MAKQLVEFEFGDGRTIQVEVMASEGGAGLAGRGGIVEKAQPKFEDAIGQIRPIAETVIKSLRDLASSPDQVSVEFGVKFSAKAGIILASADAEANLKVSLTWKRASPKGE